MIFYGSFVLLLLYINIPTLEAQDCTEYKDAFKEYFKCVLSCYQTVFKIDSISGDICTTETEISGEAPDDGYSITEVSKSLKCIVKRCKTAFPSDVCTDSSTPSDSSIVTDQPFDTFSSSDLESLIGPTSQTLQAENEKTDNGKDNKKSQNILKGLLISSILNNKDSQSSASTKNPNEYEYYYDCDEPNKGTSNKDKKVVAQQTASPPDDYYYEFSDESYSNAGDATSAKTKTNNDGTSSSSSAVATSNQRGTDAQAQASNSNAAAFAYSTSNRNNDRNNQPASNTQDTPNTYNRPLNQGIFTRGNAQYEERYPQNNNYPTNNHFASPNFNKQTQTNGENPTPQESPDGGSRTNAAAGSTSSDGSRSWWPWSRNRNRGVAASDGANTQNSNRRSSATAVSTANSGPNNQEYYGSTGNNEPYDSGFVNTRNRGGGYNGPYSTGNSGASSFASASAGRSNQPARSFGNYAVVGNEENFGPRRSFGTDPNYALSRGTSNVNMPNQRYNYQTNRFGGSVANAQATAGGYSDSNMFGNQNFNSEPQKFNLGNEMLVLNGNQAQFERKNQPLESLVFK